MCCSYIFEVCDRELFSREIGPRGLFLPQVNLSRNGCLMGLNGFLANWPAMIQRVTRDAGQPSPSTGFCHGATPLWVDLFLVLERRRWLWWCLLANNLHGKSSAVALERPAGPRHFKFDRHRIADCR
jgi:hypothetical protein